MWGVFPVGKMSKKRRRRRITAVVLLTSAVIIFLLMFFCAVYLDPEELARIQPILQSVAMVLIVSTTIVQI